MADEKPIEAAVVQPSTPLVEAPPVAQQAPAVESATPDSGPILEATVLGAEPEPVKAEGEKSAEVPEAPKPAEEVKTSEAAKPAEAPKVAEEAPKEDAPKTEDATAEAEVKPAEQVLPTYEAFALPEGVKVDDTRMQEFTSMLGNFETISKADHAEAQKFGQALVEYHVSHLQDTVQQLTKAYEDSWRKQTEDWRKQFEADPEIGGNRQDTTIAAANKFIRTHGGTEDQQKAFRSLMQKTGLGNHPDVIRILANAGMSKDHNEGTPLPAQAPAPAKMNKLQRMYGKKS